MNSWQHADLLNLERHLTEEERLARDTAARFVDERVDEPRNGKHLRGHPQRPHADPRAMHHRHPRLQLAVSAPDLGGP